MSQGALKIMTERFEQVFKHDFDDKNNSRQDLLDAAQFCFTKDSLYYPNGWNDEFHDKIVFHSSLEERLVYTGAFIAAALDKMDETRSNNKSGR